MAMNITCLREHDPEDLVDLVTKFVGMTVLGRRFKYEKWDFVWNEIDVRTMGYVDDVFVGEDPVDVVNIRRLLSAISPSHVCVETPSPLRYLLSGISQSTISINTSADITGTESVSALYGLAHCLCKLEIYGDAEFYHGLDQLVQLTHLNMQNWENVTRNFVDCIADSKLDFRRTRNLAFVNFGGWEPSIEDFLQFNALVPSLQGFGNIYLGQTPHDLIVSQERQRSIPQDCRLKRLKVLRVYVQHFNPVTFGALIEAMVEAFSGVKKLIVDVYEIPTPFDNVQYDVLFRSAQIATGLSEIVLNFDIGCETFEEEFRNAVSSWGFAVSFETFGKGIIWD
ncbi:hypothetical protein HDU76_009494 [Blyttiomyces sp. JEL0837]|nr:hypothetical protein HDU76_009494 [Blyttiomyces sp. JEL0837]